MLLLMAVLLVVLIVIVNVFMRRPQFGKLATGERLEILQKSPHYKDGQFQNLSPTPALTEGTSYYKVLTEFFFQKSKRGKPTIELPSKKVELSLLDKSKDLLVWFGHSSYFMQLDGKAILVDPVLSGSASPVKFTTRSFKGSDAYTPADMPAIDYLFITHDHWDHLDYDTIMQLKPKIKTIITGLGVGQHLEHWGFDKGMIVEKDWNQEIFLPDDFKVYTAPARHFSGRGLKRNSSLWMSFIFQTPTMKIYIGGDSGYDSHFREVGNKFGPFDLVILENGQYGKNWKYIHMLPEEVVQAAEDLKAKVLLPVHWSKFALSVHAWDEPMIRLVEEARRKNVPVVHPMIGEPLYLDQTIAWTEWWNDVK
jgi:L-ascorbate metabolism protein UlaG (beta-lactamase superfamily)